MDAGLVDTLLNDLLERAAGKGQRLLVGRVAGAAALPGRDASEASALVEFFSINIIFLTATLPSWAAGDKSYDGEVAVVGVMEIAVCIGVY